MKQHGSFTPYVNFAQFPRYRNFQKNLRINFDFPLTVVVGQNGTGKTSLLQALSGAPQGSSPGNWWFGTALDPIDAADEVGRRRRNLPASEKAAMWYEYVNEKSETCRALKLRIRRAGNPDYWEPSRPVAAYGMKGKQRDPAVPMHATYMNFKTQLNAFDRCFYFASDNMSLLGSVERSQWWQKLQQRLGKSRRRPPRIQDYLRARAKKLRKVLVDGETVRSSKNVMHKDRVTLPKSEVAEISRIIGRQYTSGHLVEHRFYESWATSVLLTIGDLQYSEAFAGSGESAVARLVHEVSGSKNGCLWLLDEPETSLHPGAQLELVRYLLTHIRDKRLQVIVSTHSPAVVRCLPREAIRVFSLDSSSMVRVDENVFADEAFFFLGHPPEHLIQLVVEDVLSKSLLEAVLRTQGDAFASQFVVTYRAGGEPGMKADAAILMLEPNNRTHFIFDGDKSETCGPIDLDTIGINSTTAQIDELIKDALQTEITFRQDSNMTDESKRAARLEYVRYLNERFHCLPCDNPEQAIWNEEVAIQFMRLLGAEGDVESVLKESDDKGRFAKLTDAVRSSAASTTSNNIQNIHDLFINRFCSDEGALFQDIVSMLREVAQND